MCVSPAAQSVGAAALALSAPVSSAYPPLLFPARAPYHSAAAKLGGGAGGHANWKDRYCVLSDHLYYYESKSVRVRARRARGRAGGCVCERGPRARALGLASHFHALAATALRAQDYEKKKAPVGRVVLCAYYCTRGADSGPASGDAVRLECGGP